MTQLSDTQALILSAAAQRPEHIALPLPESLRGGAQRDRAALLVVTPDGVHVGGGDFLDQSALEQALADVADGAALEAGGDGKDRSVLARAGGGKDDGLGIGQLDLGHEVVSVFWGRDRRSPPTTPSRARRAARVLALRLVTRRDRLP